MGTAAMRQQQDGFSLKLMVEVVGTSTPSTISFTMLGDPLVQRRMRIAWRGFFFHGWHSHGNSAGSTAYLNDPSAIDKTCYSAAVLAVLAELGLSRNLPYFAAGVPCCVEYSTHSISNTWLYILVAVFLIRFSYRSEQIRFKC
jgi:hypothetical protein